LVGRAKFIESFTFLQEHEGLSPEEKLAQLTKILGPDKVQHWEKIDQIVFTQEQATRDRLAKLQAEQERETMAAAAEQHAKRERGYYMQLTHAARSFGHAAPAGPDESEAPSVLGAGFRIIDSHSAAESAGDDFDSDFGLREEHPTGLENLIALRVLSATLKRDSPHFDALTGGSLPLTFLGADFFDFESSFSEVFSGWNPRYAFTTQYAVDADEFLLAHLEKEALVVTLYQQLGGTDYRKVAQAFIPLRGLLSPTAGIEGRAQLIHLDNPAGITSSGGVRGALRDGGDEDSDQARAMALATGRGGAPSGDAVVGELHYVLRMKRPIVSTPASPAGSRGGTPVRGMSRAGSIIGAGAGGPTNSSAAGGWSTGAGQQQQQQSRATLQHQQSSAVGSYTRQPSALGPPQQHQPQQQQTAFGAARPPSAYGAGQQQQSSGQSLSMDDFDLRHPQPQPPQAAARNLSLRPSGSNRALTTASSAAGGSSHTRDVAHALDAAAQQTQSHPQPAARTATVMELPLASSEWDEDHGGYTNSSSAAAGSSASVQRAPSSLAPQASRAGYGGPQPQSQSLQRPASMYTGSASTGPSSRRSSTGQTAAAQAAAQRERDIQDLLNNPEAQAGLFGNSSGQNTAREDAF
jgi:hypothetical protein